MTEQENNKEDSSKDKNSKKKIIKVSTPEGVIIPKYLDGDSTLMRQARGAWLLGYQAALGEKKDIRKLKEKAVEEILKYRSKRKKLTKELNKAIEDTLGPIKVERVKVLEVPESFKNRHWARFLFNVDIPEDLNEGRKASPDFGTGESNINNKLTEQEVVLIKKLIRDGLSVQQIVDYFNDSRITFWNIRSIYKGRTWKHVGEDINFDL